LKVLKRFFLLIMAFAAASATLSVFDSRVEARPARPSATASPTAAPSALPTASPEPPDKAIPRLIDKLKADPNDKESLKLLAQQYLGISRPDLALPLTNKLLGMGMKTAEVYYFDGFANEQLQRVPAAIADYEQASNLDPTNIAVLGALTQVYLKTNRLADGERVAKRAVTFNKEEKRAYINYGLVLATEGKFDDARTQFETAYAKDNSDVTPLLQIGQTYVSQNALPNALASVNRALAADPKNAQAYIFKGDILARQHDIVNALAAYEQAVAFAPDDDARATITDVEARFLAAEKKNADAEATFQRAISKYPNSLDAHIAYGDYWSATNQMSKASAEWALALGPQKNYVPALQRLAAYSLKTNHVDAAISYLEKVVQQNPSLSVFMQLGQLFTYRHDYLHAHQACRDAYQMQPNVDALGCMAGADYGTKNYKEAAAIFDALDARVKTYLSRNGTLLYIAGKSYERTNQKAKALNEYKRLLSLLKPSSPGYKQVKAAIDGLSKASPRGNASKKT